MFNNVDVKHILASKTIWGGILCFVGGAMFLITMANGQTVTTLFTILSLALIIGGSFLVWYERYTVVKKVTVSK